MSPQVRRPPPPGPMCGAFTHFSGMCGAFCISATFKKGRKKMRLSHYETLKVTLENERRFLLTTQMFKMHLYDSEAAEENAFCGEDSSPIERMSVGYYLEERLYGPQDWTVCDRCKALAMPLAEVIIEEMAEDLEDEGRLGDAEDCRDLLNKLAREKALDRWPD